MVVCNNERHFCGTLGFTSALTKINFFHFIFSNLIRVSLFPKPSFHIFRVIYKVFFKWNNLSVNLDSKQMTCSYGRDEIAYNVGIDEDLHIKVKEVNRVSVTFKSNGKIWFKIVKVFHKAVKIFFTMGLYNTYIINIPQPY